MSIETVVVGEWSPFHSLTLDEKIVFQEAIDENRKQQYIPISVSTQEVLGTNYRYLCDIEQVERGYATQQVIIEVFSPLKGKPYLEGIQNHKYA